MKRAIAYNTHPGEILWKEVLSIQGVSVDEACKLLEVPWPALVNILEGKSSITPLAPKIAAVFGGNPEFWIRLQKSYELRESKTKGKRGYVDLDLHNIKDLHLEGMNKAFSLGNPWYGKHSEDGENYLRKYLPSGEVYKVLIETRYDEQGYPVEIIDIWSERIK